MQSGTNYYLHNDHLSLRVRTNSTGTVADQRGHYPFGETWYSPSGAPLIFASYYRDTESGNDYAMARTYVNRLGRFSAPDRHSGNQSNPQSLNRYAYSLNDPVNLADPSGMDPCELIVAKHRKWLERLEIAGLGPSNLTFDADFLGQDFPPDGGCELLGGGGGGGTSDPPLDDNYNPCDPDPSRCIVKTVTDTPPTPPVPPDQGPGICDLFPSACPGVGPAGGPVSILSVGGGGNISSLKKAYCSMMPSGNTMGISGGTGGTGTVPGSFEIVNNFDTGQSTVIASGGAGFGWNGGAQGSVNAGLLWGDVSQYTSGGMTTVAASGGAATRGFGLFGGSSSNGLNGGTPNFNVTSAGISWGGSLIPTPTLTINFTGSKSLFSLGSLGKANPMYWLRKPCHP